MLLKKVSPESQSFMSQDPNYLLPIKVHLSGLMLCQAMNLYLE